MSCSCSCSSKTLKIYKGFPTTFDNVPFLTVKTDSTIDIKGWKAKFIIDDVVKTYDSLQDGFSVSLTAEETATLKNGMRSASLVLIDAQGNERPVMTDIPCLVSEWVEGDVLIDDFTFTVSLKVDETTLELKLYGAQPDVAVTAVMDAKIEQHNTSATAHADIRALIQDEATQRSDADNALSDRITSNYNQIDAINNELDTYGNIVTHNVNEFATASQGIKADTALQPQDLAPYRTSEAQDAIDATKQDVIPDLDTIREDATTGAGLKTQVETNTENIATINGKIPTQASTANQLADKDYVDNSVNNVSAFYITKNAAGDQFATKAELDSATVFYSGGVVRVPTRNDYCIVASDETHDDARTRYTYQNGQWEFQYEVNERPFTSEELAAIESGITSDLVNQYSGHVASISNPHKVNKTQVGLGNVKNVDTTNASNISSGTLSNDRLGTIPYAKLSGVQETIPDLDTIRSDAAAGKNASNTISTYGNIVTHNANEFATAAQGAKADTAVQPADLAEYAKDADVVKITGNQDVDGIKTLLKPLYSKLPSLDMSTTPTGTQRQSWINAYDKKGTQVGFIRSEWDGSLLYNTLGTVRKVNNSTIYSGIKAGVTDTGSRFQIIDFPGDRWAKTNQIDTVFARNDAIKAYHDSTKQDKLTTSQLNAVNSGITSDLVAQIGTNKASIETLQTSKQDKLTAGSNIDITDNVISTSGVLGYSQITNCITEIPQDIKLELKNGTLTLKSGSKVYVPNGPGVFDEAVTDIDRTASTTSTGSLMVIALPSGAFSLMLINKCTSGSTDSQTGTTYHCWYDTTNNVINYYGADGETPSNTRALPLGVVTAANGVITSIDQVFNGFGYIGSTVFALPGVKGLIPNGRNEDGTLKNTNFTVNNVLTTTDTSGATGGLEYYFNASGVYRANFGTVTYDEVNNKFNGAISNVVLLDPNAYRTSGKVTSFNPKNTFRAVDYNDFSPVKDDIMALSESKQDKLTTSQLTAVNSGITSDLVAQIGTNKTSIETLQASKQDTLVSGTNIKTVNGQSLLGSGDIGVVDKTSKQTIGGDKTFTGKIEVPTPSSATDNSKKTATTAWTNNFLNNKKTEIASWGIPNYAAGISISSGYVAESNGMVKIIRGIGSGAVSLYVDGVVVDGNYSNTSSEGGVLKADVKKGSTVTWDTGNITDTPTFFPYIGG